MTPDQHFQIADSIFITPDKWSLEHAAWLKHESGLKLWIANGPAHYHLEPEPTVYDSWWRWRAHKRYLRRAVEFWISRNTNQLLEGVQS